MKVSLLCLLAAGLASASQAQTPQATPPPGPLLARAPDLAQWQITITNTNDAAKRPGDKKAERKPSKTVMVVAKAGNMFHVESVDQDSQRTSIWCVGSTEYVQKTGWLRAERYDGPDMDNIYINFSKSDFPECAWVAARNYTGLKQAGGRECLTFGDKVGTLSEFIKKDMESEAGASGQKVDLSQFSVTGAAYIDLETRLPVYAIKGTEVYAYQSLPPLTEALVLPPAIDAMIKQEIQRRKDLTPHPAGS